MEEENKEEVLREIQEINALTDFDDPKLIDFDLLIVSKDTDYLTFFLQFLERYRVAQIAQAFQLPCLR